MADQPRTLAPQLDAFDHSLEMGLLLFIPDYNDRDRSYRTLKFQYNPETVTRTRQGEWTTERVRGAAKVLSPSLSKQDKSLLAGHRGGGLYAKSETIGFKLVFDAGELMLRDENVAGNVLPELAFLEQIALGGDEAMKTESKSKIKTKPTSDPKKKLSTTKPGSKDAKSSKKPAFKTRIQGTAPSELLLVLGPRSFPVVLTSLTVTEQRFNPLLEPIRAECDCKFRVLETREVKHNKPAQVAFTNLLKQRSELAVEAQTESDSARVAAIVNALEGS